MSPSQEHVLRMLADAKAPLSQAAMCVGTTLHPDTIRDARKALQARKLVASSGEGRAVGYFLTEEGRGVASGVVIQGPPNQTSKDHPKDHPSKATRTTPHDARVVSAKSFKGNEVNGGSGSAPTRTTPQGPPQEVFDALESLTRYAKRLERQAVELIAENAELRGRVSPNKTDRVRAVEPAPEVTVPVSAPAVPLCVAERDVKPENILHRDEWGHLSPSTDRVARALAWEQDKHQRRIDAGETKPVSNWPKYLEPKLSDLEADAGRVDAAHREIEKARSKEAVRVVPPEPVWTSEIERRAAVTALVEHLKKTLDEEVLADLDSRADELARERLGSKASDRRRLGLEKVDAFRELAVKEHGSMLEVVKS